ncbi:hypothetical protein BD560DRAFT_318894, partial [Blakeslea trispora]
PSMFDFTFDHRAGFYRAIDWQHILLHVVPTVIVPYKKSVQTRNALMHLVNACSISLQRCISVEELQYMERSFKQWADFLQQSVAEDQLSMRVWTMNCHFAVYHVADLIRQHGPLRYYSCRSLERTIKLLSNEVFSMSKPNKEISNIHTRFNFFNQTDVTEAFDQISSPKTNIRVDYHDHPTQPDRWPQLWEKFSNVSLNREDIVVDVPVPVCVAALQRFYNRLGLSTNHLVLFEAKHITRQQKFWYLGEVVFFSEHKFNGSIRFLALLSVILDTDMDDYGIIKANYDDERNNGPYMVCEVRDILTTVGLVRYDDELLHYKVIWLDAKYYQKLNNR